MKNVQRIIDLRGGLAYLRDNPICIDNEPYMQLCIEYVGTGPRKLPHISVAHYGKQNGDLMRDPDMTFEIAADGKWHPTSFRNDFTGTFQQSVFQDEQGRVLTYPKLVRDQSAFARTWNKTIGEQEYIRAAKLIIV